MSTPPADGSLELPDPNTNEADFQAAIVERIRAAFPLLKAGVRVERYLALKLGHHDLKVDGTSWTLWSSMVPRHCCLSS
jgi:hypothetical protein